MNGIRFKLLGAVALILIIVAAHPAAAARLHVRLGGTLAAGPSAPDVWDSTNCYGTVAQALSQAAVIDTVLVSAETHDLNEPATLCAVLAGPDMQYVPTGCEIRIGQAGGLTFNPAAPSAEIRGLTLLGAMSARTASAITIANPGAVMVDVSLSGCEIIGMIGGTMSGAGGAAVRAIGPGNGLTLKFADCVFSGNTTQGMGGAIFVGGGFDVRLTYCTFENNKATVGSRGGAMAVAAAAVPSTVQIDDCVFIDCSSGGPGGALDIDSAPLVMRRCQVLGSRSAAEENAWWKEGAGLRVYRSGGHTEPVLAQIEDCEFRDNRGQTVGYNGAGDGGGILAKGADPARMLTVDVRNCVFQDNYNAQGAGLYVGRFCTGDVAYCRFLNNTSWYQGGGAFKGGELPECVGETARFIYCEFRGNRAGYSFEGEETNEYSRGGGVMVRFNPRAFLYNCSFLDNTVNNYSYAIGDGFADASEGYPWQENTGSIVVNCAFWGHGNDIQLRTEGTGGMAEAGNLAVEAGQIATPGLTPSGMVWLTSSPYAGVDDMQPISGSPLIDMGADLGYQTDLLGREVPALAGPDIGCYEYQDEFLDVAGPPAAGAIALTASPNPFNPRTVLTARLGAAALARVAVYDARGSRIADLYQGELPAGATDLVWDGCDAEGRGVAAGLYVARIEVAGQPPVAVKLALVR